MPSAEILLTFTLAALLMNMSPGPSSLYVISRSIAQGTKAGIIAALGLAVGSLFYVIVTVLGLSALFQHFPLLYSIIKLTGAVYLLYLGRQYWQEKPTENDGITKPAKPKSFPTIFKESIIVEITNPKTALFFIALLPQFVEPQAGSVSLQLFILGAIVTLSALPWDIFVAVSSNKVFRWLAKSHQAQAIQTRVSGSILLALGAYIMVDEIIEYTR